MLLDTSGTYTQELNRAKQLINYMLATLEPGDVFAVARIDSRNFVKRTSSQRLSWTHARRSQKREEAKVGNKAILIYSDLKKVLPEGYVRKFELLFDGFTIKAPNVTKLRADNPNPQVYLDRVRQ